ncbi:hypothetical protein IL54_1222 [Sphingobium sp. ba1]|nr:hypothetical protein IL54_1222 [Sphingobium sp. ba1]
MPAGYAASGDGSLVTAGWMAGSLALAGIKAHGKNAQDSNNARMVGFPDIMSTS